MPDMTALQAFMEMGSYEAGLVDLPKRKWAKWVLKAYKEKQEIVSAALTPPTAEEVCEELENIYPHKVLYDDERNMFFSYSHFETMFTIAQCHENGNISLDNITKQKPKTLELIGRFYEAQNSEVHSCK